MTTADKPKWADVHLHPEWTFLENALGDAAKFDGNGNQYTFRQLAAQYGIDNVVFGHPRPYPNRDIHLGLYVRSSALMTQEEIV